MRAALVALVALALVACSGGDDGAASAPGATVIPPGATTTTIVGESAIAPGGAPDLVTSPTRRVEMSVESTQLGVSAELSGEAGGDPFGDFASCSGLARHVGSYAVGVGDADGQVRWVSAVTAQRIDGPGPYDADVRIELADGSTIDAIGNMTLADGLVSGTFSASTVDAELVTGRFDCAGDSTPTLVGGEDAGLVEVVALLQQGGAERVVSVASDDPTVVDCPLGAGGQPLVVRVDGDSSIGTIRAFELLADGPASLVMRIGDEVYEFGDVDVEVAADAGIFSASPVIGPAVDGAFSCT